MYIGNQPSQAAFVTDTFSGNSSTTAFTMSVAPAGTTSVLVAISGVLQDPSTYSVSGTTLTFSAAPPTGTGNISARYLGIPASGVTTTAYRTVTEFTATAGQTTFTPPSYTVGFISVYRNGSRLGSTDYTATNGTTVVLAVGAATGDLVTVESFLVSSVLNAIPNTANSVTWTNLPTGSVLQVVNATYNTQVNNSTSAYADTGLTATITPKFSTSKVLAIVSQNGVAKYSNDTGTVIQLLRGSTSLAVFSGYAGQNGGTAANGIGSVSIEYLDSPSTTSATTYKTQFNSVSNNASASVQTVSAVSTITLLEIAG
jgi:hypothetical protein